MTPLDEGLFDFRVDPAVAVADVDALADAFDDCWWRLPAEAHCVCKSCQLVIEIYPSLGEYTWAQFQSGMAKRGEGYFVQFSAMKLRRLEPCDRAALVAHETAHVFLFSTRGPVRGGEQECDAIAEAWGFDVRRLRGISHEWCRQRLDRLS